MITINRSNNKNKTIVVLGNARGGTSAIAGLLRELGVEMPNASSLIHEWSPITESGRSNAALRTIVKNYNSQFTTWGWKYPNDVFNIEKYASIFRNLHIVLIFRNLLDVAKSASMHENVLIEAVLPEVIDIIPPMRRIITHMTCPISFVSYEDLIKKPQESVIEINNTLQLNATEAQLAAALNFIDQKNYKNVSFDDGSGIPAGQTAIPNTIDGTEKAASINPDDNRESAVTRMNIYRGRIEEFNDSLLNLKGDVVAAEDQVNHLMNELTSLLHTLHPGTFQKIGRPSMRWLYRKISGEDKLVFDQLTDDHPQTEEGNGEIIEHDDITLSRIMYEIYKLSKEDYKNTIDYRLRLQSDMENLLEILSVMRSKKLELEGKI